MPVPQGRRERSTIPTETLTRTTPTILFKSVLKYQHPGTLGSPPIGAASAMTTVGNIITNPVKNARIFFFMVSSFLVDHIV
jgi:hypothetical protein